MFYLDMPPVDSVQHVPMIVAEATVQQPVHAKVDHVIGVCQLIENPPIPEYTAVNTVNVLGDVSVYLLRFENKNLWLSGTVNILQNPKHGSLEMGERGADFHPVPDYYGSDSTTFLVNANGLVIKVKYDIKILQNVPGGTEGFDPYEDKKYCPNGAYWTIPNTADEG